MLEINTISKLRKILEDKRSRGMAIGFVPTMGYFHEGHLTLMREAKKLADIVVVSIFINPTQFSPGEDLDEYPRDLERDRLLAKGAGVDILFVPTVAEMYPDGYATYVEVAGGITDVLCGRSRPGHFRGVATVVAKLFNIVSPDVALFGEKDWQQLAVIKRMVHDLNMDVEIVGIPTVRDEDGLAMSSRNVYLAPRERDAALILSKALKLAHDIVNGGERDPARLAKALRDLINAERQVKLEYLEICDPENLAPVDEIREPTLVAIAAKVGKARLIDNTIIHPGELEKSGELF
ncbi:MAG: pantoate--beta-alanine ligase [Firmicutes bacterium]|nr:pantoate--beta-alanine ligase [Bacillota bacterium]